MDPVTHALSGALLASAAKRRAASRGNDVLTGTRAPLATWKWVLVLAVAAMSPDVDILLEQISNIATLTDRRGITHSLIGLPFMALIVGGLFTLIFRDRARFLHYVAIAAVGVALHIVFDLINAFGVMLFAPFSFQRFDWGITFIIDVWLGLMMLCGLIASLVWRRSRVPAMVASALVLGYFATMWWAKMRAEEFARASARTLMPMSLPTDVSINAYPRPLSPFNWTIVLGHAEQYRIAHVNLLAASPITVTADAGLITRVRAQFKPLQYAEWKLATRFGATGDVASSALAQRAWSHPDFAFFRSFAEAPAYMSTPTLPSSKYGQCAFFEDLRFVSPGREAHPFRYGVCFASEANADAKVYRYADDGQHALVPHPRRLLF